MNVYAEEASYSRCVCVSEILWLLNLWHGCDEECGRGALLRASSIGFSVEEQKRKKRTTDMFFKTHPASCEMISCPWHECHTFKG